MCTRPATSCCARRCAVPWAPPWAPGVAMAGSALPMAGQCCALRAARCPSGRSAWTLPLLPQPACTAGARAPGLPGARRGTVLPVPARGHPARPPRERAGPARHAAIQRGRGTRVEQSAGCIIGRSGRHRGASENRLNRSARVHGADRSRPSRPRLHQRLPGPSGRRLSIRATRALISVWSSRAGNVTMGRSTPYKQ